MKYTFLILAVCSAVLLLTFCSKSPEPIQVKMADFEAKRCVNDSVCAEIRLSYPVISGGDSAAVRKLNDSIQIVVYLAAQADATLGLDVALDSAAANLYQMLQDDFDSDSSLARSYSIELDSRTAMKTKRYLSLEMNGYAYTGGAHGYYYTVLNTFDIGSAASVLLPEIIADTAALRPLLENAFLKVHQKEQPGLQLSDLLLDPDAPLDFPANYCVVPEGVRFVYNPYEVAAYAVGQTDFTLTWKELGVLADAKKWKG